MFKGRIGIPEESCLYTRLVSWLLGLFEHAYSDCVSVWLHVQCDVIIRVILAGNKKDTAHPNLRSSAPHTQSHTHLGFPPHFNGIRAICRPLRNKSVFLEKSCSLGGLKCYVSILTHSRDLVPLQDIHAKSWLFPTWLLQFR